MYHRSGKRHDKISVHLRAVRFLCIHLPLCANKDTRLSLQQIAEGGTIAEEVINTIRTAHAFGTQTILANLYKSKINRSLDHDQKGTIVYAGGYAFFLFLVYAGYALG